ncbi:MAG: hypothetical protein KGJ13_02765 [Patescibacteria group bacterium]|nr:hypothetical protein [Patescibacteria group bacterium]
MAELRRGPVMSFSPDPDGLHFRDKGAAGFIELKFWDVSRQQIGRVRISASISIPGRPDSGFIHFHPNRAELDEIISHLQRIRGDMPEGEPCGDGLYS